MRANLDSSGLPRDLFPKLIVVSVWRGYSSLQDSTMEDVTQGTAAPFRLGQA
jgi:hypothetical protein